VIDQWLILIPSALVMLVLVPFEEWSHLDAALQQTTWRTAVVYGAFAPVYVAQWTLVSMTGQSIGKRLLGLRILRTNGRLPGFLYGVVLRNWVIAAMEFVVPFLGFVDAVFVLFPPRPRTDRWSNRGRGRHRPRSDVDARPPGPGSHRAAGAVGPLRWRYRPDAGG
jgi:hypothetical protein